MLLVVHRIRNYVHFLERTYTLHCGLHWTNRLHKAWNWIAMCSHCQGMASIIFSIFSSSHAHLSIVTYENVWNFENYILRPTVQLHYITEYAPVVGVGHSGTVHVGQGEVAVDGVGQGVPVELLTAWKWQSSFTLWDLMCIREHCRWTSTLPHVWVKKKLMAIVYT